MADAVKRSRIDGSAFLALAIAVPVLVALVSVSIGQLCWFRLTGQKGRATVIQQALGSSMDD